MAKKWIQAAIRHPGALTRSAKRAGKSPMSFAREKQHAGGTTGQRARLALTLRGLKHAGREHPASNRPDYDNIVWGS